MVAGESVKVRDAVNQSGDNRADPVLPPPRWPQESLNTPSLSILFPRWLKCPCSHHCVFYRLRSAFFFISSQISVQIQNKRVRERWRLWDCLCRARIQKSSSSTPRRGLRRASAVTLKGGSRPAEGGPTLYSWRVRSRVFKIHRPPRVNM